MGKSNFSINFQLAAYFLVIIFVMSACDAGLDTETQSAPIPTNTIAIDSMMGDRLTPLPEISNTPMPTAIVPTSTAVVGFDCGIVDQIPAEECAALVALFNNTSGKEWIDNNGWLDSNLPCTWSGVECTDGHISHVGLPYNGLRGPLPPELGNLSQLVSLTLSFNQVQGIIPAEIGNLTQLVFLDLGGNQLTGSLPAELGNLTNLKFLTLGNNQISGSTPPALGNLENLESLYLLYNQLSGPIPPELGDLANLTQLYLSHNELSGAVPITLNELNNLFELDLSYNQLSGAVPENLTQIDQRMLWGNQFDGTIITDEQVQFEVDFMGVHFSADSSLASSIWPELKSATPLPEVQDGPSFWLALPRHLRFTFADPNLPPTRKRMGFNLAAEGQILVFPLAELAEVNPLVQAQIETLQNLLAEREQVPSGELPLLPLTNSVQVFQAQVQYLDFDNFQGIRFISQHSQDPRPIALSQEIFYTFQGVSNDGAYYVAAFFPLTTAVLPDTIDIEDWDAFFANYDTYLTETTAVLNGLSTAEFTPDLALLDAVITSLKLDLDNSFS